MRLIDADALNLDYEVETADDWKTAHEIANVIKYAPTVDAVPVVRCKDCKHFAGEFMYCAFNIIVPFDYFFCLHGRREEDNEAD